MLHCTYINLRHPPGSTQLLHILEIAGNFNTDYLPSP